MKYLIILLILSVGMRASQADTEKELALKSLNRQILLIDRIKQNTERMDIPRLKIMREASSQTLGVLKERNNGHNLVHQHFLYQVISYDSSDEFLESIKTDESVADVNELLKIADDIKKIRGYDKSLWSKIIKSILTQIVGVLDQIITSLPPEDLKRDLKKTKVELGKALGIASRGDKTNAFLEGIRVYYILVDLYPKLNKTLYSQDIFDLVIELRGRNEYLGEFVDIKLYELKHGKKSK